MNWTTAAHTLVATGAVLTMWVIVTLVLVGLGFVTRRALLGLAGIPSSASVCIADVWTGLAALTGYLLFWSLVAAIGPATWMLPLVGGAVGLVWLLRTGVRRPRLGLATIPFALLVVWLANLSLGHSYDYDAGLYHFAAIDYASHSAAIPGIGNLHDRLSAGGAHFLFVAFLGVRPWSGAGQHLANGLLVSLLLVHIWTVIVPHRPPPHHLMSWRLALLAVPAVVIVVAVNPVNFISSPSLDLMAFVLVIAAGIALAQGFERALDMRFVVGGTAALATGVASRPHIIPALVAALVLVLIAARDRGGRRLLSTAAASAMLPVTLMIGLAARQTILSGYPLWPSGLLAAPVDWKVPHDVLTSYRALVSSWARSPGNAAQEIPFWGDWIVGWSKDIAESATVNVAFILAAGAAALPLIYRSEADRAERRERRGPAAVVLIPSAVALLVWFYAAPDWRLGLGWIWLLALGLVAWLAPALTIHGLRSLAAWVSVAVLAVGVARAFILNPTQLRVAAIGDGPFRSASATAPQTRPFETSSGLRVLVPTSGDQCWRVMWCTPYPNPRLEQRGANFRNGFSVARR